MRSFGFLESGYSDKDIILSLGSSDIPKEYEHKILSKVFDQGSNGSCVSCTITEMYNFICSSEGRNLDIDFEYIFNKRKDKSINGMTPREGFEILKSENRILSYAKINDIMTLKKSIISNGPCLIALQVRSENDDFWNGSENLGGHAVAVVGFNRDELLIKNSWGYQYGNGGYMYAPNEIFSKLYECWTIIN
jgi:C1A family cysteine protease